MIVRNAAVRQGRATAVLAPLARTCVRSISTEPPSTSARAQVLTPPPPPATAPGVAPRVLDPRLQARFGMVKKTAAADTRVEDYFSRQKLRKRASKVGSVVDRLYVPGHILRDPPAPKDITLELLLASQCHMGHNTSLWNPANSRYIYGVRQGIHIISLEQTAAHLRRASRLVEEVAYHGGLVLFVGTRKNQMEVVVRAARMSKGCHLFTKWTPGAITNRDRILAGGDVKVVDQLDRELPGFEKHLLEARPLTPDLVVCLNPLENFILLHECSLANIPTVGVIDTNADPTKVTYPIPANDDSLRSIAVIAGVLGRAGELGQKRRLADAEQGVVTWENPADVARFMDMSSRNAAAQLRELAAGDLSSDSALLG